MNPLLGIIAGIAGLVVLTNILGLLFGVVLLGLDYRREIASRALGSGRAIEWVFWLAAGALVLVNPDPVLVSVGVIVLMFGFIIVKVRG